MIQKSRDLHNAEDRLLQYFIITHIFIWVIFITMYTQNQVFEPVEVIAYFHELKIEIVKFKWNNKVYKVNQMMNTWKIPDGDGFSSHFVVLCKENELLCELSFNHTDLKWELVQYDTVS